ncbi:hypothetical protein RCL_jg1078.t1 [Rhizophagus clarus]|uniref:Uncharacterized protein n=1 Tax=Rhizophagus clarus TaxID=94130 RepID=A0A8H3M9N0_9GLOM|nr:hypothetical protein RCL_jg1078.t1 [Rhizophagus clarus]
MIWAQLCIYKHYFTTLITYMCSGSKSRSAVTGAHLLTFGTKSIQYFRLINRQHLMMMDRYDDVANLLQI